MAQAFFGEVGITYFRLPYMPKIPFLVKKTGKHYLLG
jgi:hypothetical protein